MPFRNRKRKPRKSNRKPKFRKRFTMSRPITKRHHTFSFNQNLGVIANSTVANNAQFYSFKLSDVLDVAHITGLFDQYRIRKVILEFQPIQTEVLMSQPTNATAPIAQIPMILSAIDRDSNTAPATLDEVREYSSMKELPATKYFKWVFKPSVLAEVYRSAISTNYNPKFDTWLDTSSGGGADVPHYGLKLIMGLGGSADNVYKYNVKSTYIIECKTIR